MQILIHFNLFKVWTYLFHFLNYFFLNHCVRQCSKVVPVEPMAPATVEVDLRGDAGATAGELETGWGGRRSRQVKSQRIYSIDVINSLMDTQESV